MSRDAKHVEQAKRYAREQLKANGPARNRDAAAPIALPGSEPQWEPPVPLCEIPAVPPFPLDILPGALRLFVQEAAAAIACPPDYLGVPLLAVAGCAIGAGRALEIKAGWRERPALYAAVVGPPGSAKTPALNLVARPVYAEQSRRIAHYRRELVAFEESEGERVPKPTPPAVFVSDITTEALAGVLQQNPRGVALIRDELTSWVAGMDQYRAKGRGADRQFYLAAWAGEPVQVHRKNQEDGPVFVPHPFLGVVGGLPPDLLSRLRGERSVSDGFLDRILFAYPEPPPAVGETWAAVCDESRATWEETLTRLWALEPEDDGEGAKRPRFLRLDSSGRQAWVRFTRDLADEINRPDLSDCLRGPWSKLRSYGARLALVVHLLRLATGEAPAEDVDGESMGRAAALVRYFQGQARKVYCALEADREAAKAKRLLAWIQREQRTEFKSWEAFEDLKNQSEFPGLEALEAAQQLLCKHNITRRRSGPAEKGAGRPQAPVYEVNPHVLQHPANPGNPGN
jgi:hypothetical protein